MARPAVVPIILNDVDLLLGADNYEAHASQVQFDPTSGIVRWKGLAPKSMHAFGTEAEWACVLSYAQDWATANSLSRYLFENQGKAIVVKFKPKKPATGTAPTWTATIIIAPGSIGGQVDSVAAATVTVGVVGAPALAVE